MQVSIEVITTLNSVCSTNNVTKGNIEKMRAYGRTLPLMRGIDEKSKENNKVVYFISDIVSFMELQLRKPAVRRLKISECLDRINNISAIMAEQGCISYEHEVIEG